MTNEEFDAQVKASLPPSDGPSERSWARARRRRRLPSPPSWTEIIGASLVAVAVLLWLGAPRSRPTTLTVQLGPVAPKIQRTTTAVSRVTQFTFPSGG